MPKQVGELKKCVQKITPTSWSKNEGKQQSSTPEKMSKANGRTKEMHLKDNFNKTKVWIEGNQ